MEQKIAKRLQDLFRTGCSVLLVDASQLMQDTIGELIEEVAPLAVVTVVTKHEYRTIDEVVAKRPIDIAFVSGHLGTWHHPVYHAYGPNIVPMIRKTHPNAVIIAISTDPLINQVAVTRGADEGIVKHELDQLRNLQHRT